MAQKEVIEKIKQYIQLLRMNGMLVSKAYLYGSHARNEEKEDSDIDVILISDSIDYSNDSNVGKVWMFAYKIDPRIEPIVITSKKFSNDDYTPLYESIRREGIEIKA